MRLLILLVFLVISTSGQAQFLKGLGKKIEQITESTIERRTEEEAGKSTERVIDNVLKAPKKVKNSQKKSKKSKKEEEEEIVYSDYDEEEDYDVEYYYEEDDEEDDGRDRTVISRSGDRSMHLPIPGSDDCRSYYPLKKGAQFQLTHYDPSDNISFISDYEVTELYSIPAGVEGYIRIRSTEGSGETLIEQEMRVWCKNNTFSIDFESLLDPKVFEQFGDFDYELSGSNLEWPENLKVGSKLPDADLVMKMNVSGMNMNMKVDIVNRKVIAKESITTKAGTFDTYVLTYDTKSSMMGITSEISSKQWITPGIGLIKQENFLKGKLQDKSELTLLKM